MNVSISKPKGAVRAGRSRPGIGKRLKRLLRKLRGGSGARRLSSKPVADGSESLNQDALISEFRKLVKRYCAEGRLAEADHICQLALEIKPHHPWFALTHAKIADDLGDSEKSLSRWRRVIEINGDQSPVHPFKTLADGLLLLGRFEQAEAVVRQGMLVHPQNAKLEERLARIARASGYSANAVQLWTRLMERHPETRSGWIHRRIADALASEGLLQRALAVLDDGLALNPGDSPLLEARARIAGCPESSGTAACAPSDEDFTAHLCGANLRPFGKGTCTFPFPLNEMNQHVPALLDFAECIAPFRDAQRAGEVDVFTTWGASSHHPHDLAMRLAALTSKPHLCLEYGFISSVGLAINLATQHSIILSRGSAYFDATRPSEMENKLNAPDWQLDDAQLRRASSCIRLLLEKRVTKYNHAPLTNLRARFPASAAKRRVLLVDQRFGDISVEKGLAGPSTFQRMWQEALALPEDHEILVKLHPDAISGGQGSYFGGLVPQQPPPHVHLLAEDLNPYDLFDVADEVWVSTSQLGFEALMAGREVVCFGVPFYAGWGLTRDRVAVPRRQRRRTLEELFHLFYIEHSRYLIPQRGLVTPEEIIPYFAELRDQSVAPQPAPAETGDSTSAVTTSQPALRILMIPTGGRLSPSGRYMQNLAWSLTRLGCEILMLADGKCPPIENGVRWLALKFEGTSLSAALREEVLRFAPDVVYENGVRSRSQRAALEILVLTGARLAMQSEDDDVQVYETHHGSHAAEILTLVDKPRLSLAEAADYLHRIDLRHSIASFLDPSFDRWVEPITRALCYRLAMLHTVVWRPFGERLEQEYGAAPLVVPPVAASADFERTPLTPVERAKVLEKHGIDPRHTVFFIGGALYAFSNEYALFLEALNQLSTDGHSGVALVVASARSPLPVAQMARNRLRPSIGFADIGHASDDVYLEMLKACDIVCSPGLPDTFNRYRLPSRLVKAMAMGKPVLTCRCGFGESLEHGVNAFLTEGVDPDGWAWAILPALDAETRREVGEKGRIFARANFESDRVAISLKAAFEELMSRPKRSLSDGIEISPSTGNSSRTAKAGLNGHPRSRYESTMQDAIHKLIASNSRPHTVVHCGAGRGSEVEDYCRMGAARILLIEASPPLAMELAKLTDLDGAITVKHAAISPAGGTRRAFVCANARADSDPSEEYSLLQPTRLLDIQAAMRVAREESVHTSSLPEVLEGMIWTSERNLLVLELNGLEGSVLEATPAWQLQAFQWICMRLPESPLQENGATLGQVVPIMEAAGFDHLPAFPNHAEPTLSAMFIRRGAITALMRRCCGEPQRELALRFFNAVASHAAESRAQLRQDLWALWETGLKRNGYFVEFGAMDGLTLSNTWVLEKKFGWSGIIAEPNPIHAEALSKNRECVISLDCVAPVGGKLIPFLATPDPEFSRMEELSPDDNHESEGRRSNSQRILVPTVSLNELLERSGAPADPDFLSIDTEGSELPILESLDFARWRFRTIAVEHNYTGAQGLIDELLVSKGYTRRFPAMSEFDGWYVRGDMNLHS
jgi:FkbM family methyltransferase